MEIPIKPASEPARLKALADYEILDTIPESVFDNVTLIASQICNTPIALISLLDEKRQWFKSHLGLTATETPRELSFCGHAITSGEEVFEISNSLEDPRFADNPLVVNDPHVVFYAGAPLNAPNGERIGTLCVIDSKPKQLDRAQKVALRALADQVMVLFESRKRERAEKILAAKSDLATKNLQAVFDSSQIAMALVREPDFIFEQINDAFKRLVSTREYLGNTWLNVYGEEAALPFLHDLKEVYKTGKRRIESEIQIPIFSDNGIQNRSFNITFDRIEKTETADYAVLIQLVDVTSEVLNRSVIAAKDAAVSESQNLLSETLKNLPIAVAIFEGPEQRFAFVNENHSTYFGGRNNFVGKTLLEAIPEFASSEIPSIMEEVFKTGNAFAAEEFPIGVTQSDQRIQKFILKLSFQPVRNVNGKITGIVTTAVDVTEAVQARNQLVENNLLLQNTQKLLAEATTVAKIGFYDWDIPNDLLSFSDQMQRDWGIKAEAPLNDVVQAIHPLDRQDVTALIRESMDSHSSYSTEYRVIQPSGEVIWIEAKGQVTYDADNKPLRFVGTSVNITSRKNAENEVVAIANSIPQLAWSADPTGHIYWYNQRWFDYTGTTLSQMEGWGWKDVHDPEHVDRVVTKYKECWEAGNEWEDTFPLKGKDGTYRWFLSRATPIRDDNGNILRWFGTNTDITDQLKNESALTRLAAVVESSRDFIGMSDSDFNPIFVNRGGREMTGFGNRDATQVAITDFFPDEQIPKIKSEVIPALLANGFWEGEMQFKHFDNGLIIPVLYNLFPIIDRNGVTIGYATVTRDISELKKNEEALKEARDLAERANAAKSAFLANMSHEIRTPLGAIMGFSDLARLFDADTKTLQSYLDVIHRNSVQTLKIVDDILDLAKVEAGKVLIEELDTDLISFLADFGSLMGFKARENGIQFILRAETDLPNWVRIDPTRVRQVLTNAVGNAIKFTSNGSVVLHVCYVENSLKFGITDTGRGISSEQAANLFQAFVQADDSTTRKFGGTGLGLILSKKLCQQMGGDFTLERSELGEGSHFLAIVRAARPNESTILKKNSVDFRIDPKIAVPTNQKSLTGIRILVVEDSPDNQELLKIILGKQGATFVLAKDGIEGVEKAMSEQFDIILMDVQMPRMDGHEAVRKMRSLNIKRPILALTAHAMKEEFDRAIASGFTDYLTKPVNKHLLLEMILKYLEKNQTVALV